MESLPAQIVFSSVKHIVCAGGRLQVFPVSRMITFSSKDSADLEALADASERELFAAVE